MLTDGFAFRLLLATERDAAMQQMALEMAGECPGGQGPVLVLGSSQPCRARWRSAGRCLCPTLHLLLVHDSWHLCWSRLHPAAASLPLLHRRIAASGGGGHAPAHLAPGRHRRWARLPAILLAWAAALSSRCVLLGCPSYVSSI